MKHTFSISALLAIIWLANSGHYSGLLLGFGAASVALVVWISHRMDVVDHESQPIHLTRHLPRYYAWLTAQIIVSNIDVAKRIWSGNSTISPGMRRFPVSQKTDIGRVIYANSINLTPGTIAVELSDNEVLVHGLTQSNLDDLDAGAMSRRVNRLE
ncbi:Na+/H+ antiporter subunit E [Zhongshania aliphaticivorans]|uniref:Na+/H+ antiporter subunit E n=1 Tax=Zhongshania aliphaticivorans TaxID=1470434 RepID=UPI0012E54A54|nr:Na+/H+ antiporter subunit E [Zhongshania aliphaticivorans]CAA0107165.1 Na(+)/H(+) antiporter subunit E [Zhongshania aliphaticivorans]